MTKKKRQQTIKLQSWCKISKSCSHFCAMAPFIDDARSTSVYDNNSKTCTSWSAASPTSATMKTPLMVSLTSQILKVVALSRTCRKTCLAAAPGQIRIDEATIGSRVTFTRISGPTLRGCIRCRRRVADLGPLLSKTRSGASATKL